MFCVYITFYSGSKLPPLYIGSSSVKKVLDGYHGTVKSKLYKETWLGELSENPDAFETFIHSTFLTRKEAVHAELMEQIYYNVVKNPKFINRSFATINGCFTMDKHGEKNPMFGRKHSAETRQKISANSNNKGTNNPMFGKPPTMGMLNKKHSEESKAQMSKKKKESGSQKGARNAMYGKFGSEHPSYGYKHKADFIKRLKVPKPLVVCPHCGVSGGKPAMARFHFDKCKKLFL
jgi:hypothetical protein